MAMIHITLYTSNPATQIVYEV